MFPAAKKKLTAEQVRALPVGTRVVLHGQDRFGTPTQLQCTVIQSGKRKVLSYLDESFLTATRAIKDYPNKCYTEGEVQW